MKINTKIVLTCAVLLALAMASMNRATDSSQAAGACCPLMAALNGLTVTVSTNEIATNAPDQQVIAYYFHGAVRCETCLKIEKQAKEVIEEQFKTELDAKRLVFKSINYDQSENAHFLYDYKLPCPSLVLVRQKNGKDEKWTLLNETWQLVEKPGKLNNYVETETRKFLDGQEKQPDTDKAASPSAAGLR